MLEVSTVDDEYFYTVFNDFGDVLLVTRDGALAHFIDKHCKGIPRGVYMRVGGDRGMNVVAPLWCYRRKVG
jgi:hypothetical protein